MSAHPDYASRGVPPAEFVDESELTYLERVRTTREFCEIKRAPPERLCGPLVHRGERLMIGATTGHGKSTYALQLGRAAALGEGFLGWTGIGGIRVLVLDAEQGALTLERRFRAMGLDRVDSMDILSIPEGAAIDRNETERGQMEEVLREGDYSIVIADPQYKLFGGDSGSEQEAVGFTKIWDRWRLGNRGAWPAFALILPCHARKPPPKAPFTMAEIYGNTAWLRGAEQVIGLQRMSHGYSQLYFWKDRDSWGADEPEETGYKTGDIWGLKYDRDTGFERGKVRTRESGPDAIMRLLTERPMLVEELMEALPGANGNPPAARSSVDRWLRELEDQVHFSKVGKSKLWKLAPEVEAEMRLDEWENAAGTADDGDGPL